MEEDRLTTVFYAAVNPDGTHGELKELGKGVIDISTQTIDEAVVDSFTKYLKGAIPLSESKTADFVIDVMMQPSTLATMLSSSHLLDEVKKLVVSNPPGGFILLCNPEDINIIQFGYSQLKMWGLDHMVPTNLVEKGTVYWIPCDIFSRTFGYSAYSDSEKVFSMFGTQTDTIAIDELATKVQSEPQVRDISWIRKQMKHCKNPMERKALEKELNAAFKEKKRRRKNE